jgi:hypothetical protein
VPRSPERRAPRGRVPRAARAVAEVEPIHPCSGRELLQQDRPGQDRARARPAHRRQGGDLLHCQGRQARDDSAQVAEPQLAQAADHRAAFTSCEVVGEVPTAGGGARGGDHPVGRFRCLEFCQALAHRAPEALERARGRRIALEHRRAAQRAQGHALHRTQVAAPRHAPFGRAAADVGENDASLREIDGVLNGAKDQRALLLARQDANVEPREGADLGQELKPVGRLAHRARGDGDDLACPLETRERGHLEQGFEALAHRFRRQRAVGERRLAEPHHVALPRQDLVGAGGSGAAAFDDHHMNRVRADVDRCDAAGRDRGSRARGARGEHRRGRRLAGGGAWAHRARN